MADDADKLALLHIQIGNKPAVKYGDLKHRRIIWRTRNNLRHNILYCAEYGSLQFPEAGDIQYIAAPVFNSLRIVEGQTLRKFRTGLFFLHLCQGYGFDIDVPGAQLFYLRE